MARAATIYDHDASASVPMWLLREKGTLVNVSGNQPLWLDDPKSVWIIFSGKVDVFAVQLEDNREAGSRDWLFRAETGQALFGFEAQAQCPNTAILASGAPGTSLLRLERARLEELALDRTRGGDIAQFVNDWVLELVHALAGSLLSRDYEDLEPGETALPAGRVAFPAKAFLWVRHVTGSSRFMGTQTLPPESKGVFLPISKYTWLQTVEPGTIQAVTTPTYLSSDRAWQGLDAFHALVLERVCDTSQRQQEQERQRLQAKTESDRAIVDRALARLSVPLQPNALSDLATDEGREPGPLLTACRWVGNALNIHFRPSPDTSGDRAPRDPLDSIAHASRVNKRRVVLRGEWWREDNGPLLAFVGDTEFEHPVALLPVSPTRYRLRDPADQSSVQVTRQVAATLYPFAYTFYRPFPARALNAWDLWRFGQRDTRKDLWAFAWMGIAGGALGLLIPLATGWIFDTLIPSAAQGQIAQVFAALIASAVASAVFQFVRGIALLRLQIRASGSVQSAIWDRLLSLPATFFRDYSAGDLSSRAMGIDKIRRTLGGTTISTILSGVFSVFNVALMIYYSPLLALVGTVLVVLAIVVMMQVGRAQVRHQRTLAHIRGQIAGTILQFVTGVTKLRVAGAEGRAFAVWAKRFAAQKETDHKAQTFANGLAVFNAMYPIVNSMAIFALSALTTGAEGGVTLSPGQFVAFYAAFGQLLTAGLSSSAALLSASDLIPTYERVKPILETLPEVDEVKADPGELSGEIDIDHVDFRYRQDSPQVLHDLSMHIEPGEFVALVGPSGSGKSTLLRLLLGFEYPQSGTILFDGQDLSELDVRAVRRQIGVVLQTGKLMRGTILDNIIGSSLLSVEDAWTAARLVGLDQDIKQMPMGMYTIISTGGSTLSGGQRQRILIARAIVHRPRILIFDEATSALDNVTQAVVSKSLERIQATRIVIAHRLSTIRQADRIFVLNRGRVIQTGTFEELSKQEGLFADLAHRQIA